MEDLLDSRLCREAMRDFDSEMVERVVLIQHLLAAGLCSATIAEMLPCLEAPPQERTGLLEVMLAEEVERLEAKRRDIDRELGVLQALQRDVVCAGLVRPVCATSAGRPARP